MKKGKTLCLVEFTPTRYHSATDRSVKPALTRKHLLLQHLQQLQKPPTVPKPLSSSKSCGCWWLPEGNNCRNLLQSQNPYHPPNPADAGCYQRTTIAETSYSPETAIILRIRLSFISRLKEFPISRDIQT